MNTETLVQRFHDRMGTTATGFDGPKFEGPDALIGFFQSFRPDGNALHDLFDDLEGGDGLQDRLASLYETAGDDRRPQGGRDAYFVVRRPAPLDPDLASDLAGRWLAGVRGLAESVGDSAVVDALDPAPRIRVLEGIAPKHPKNDDEKSSLLRVMQQNVPKMVEQLDVSPHAEALRPAYYFIACDEMLRDYLMWPLYAKASGQADPLQAYFRLWQHGVKYRIFTDDQIDIYLPRPPVAARS